MADYSALPDEYASDDHRPSYRFKPAQTKAVSGGFPTSLITKSAANRGNASAAEVSTSLRQPRNVANPYDDDMRYSDKREKTRGLFKNRKLPPLPKAANNKVQVRREHKTKRGRRRYVIKDTVISKRRLAAYAVGESIDTTILFRKLESKSMNLSGLAVAWTFASHMDVLHAYYTKESVAELKTRSASAPEVVDMSGIAAKDAKSSPVRDSRSSADAALKGPVRGRDSLDDGKRSVEDDSLVPVYTDEDFTDPEDIPLHSRFREGPAAMGEEEVSAAVDVPVVDEAGILQMNSQVDVFFFSEGCIVFWGCENEAEELAIIQNIKSFVTDVFDDDDWYEDEVAFSYSLGKDVRPHLDVVYLSTLAYSEKLAVSYAYAQSVKLESFEDDVEAVITENADVPNQLAQTGHIRMGKKELSKRIGRLFITRTAINLRSELLDTPEYFWDTDQHEPKYHSTLAYFDVVKRISLINTRLDTLNELLQMLTSQQEHAEGSRLEWIVIILILVEIILAIHWNEIFAKLFTKS